MIQHDMVELRQCCIVLQSISTNHFVTNNCNNTSLDYIFNNYNTEKMLRYKQDQLLLRIAKCYYRVEACHSRCPLGMQLMASSLSSVNHVTHHMYWDKKCTITPKKL